MTVNFDHGRSDRTGISEVILAEPKHIKDLKEAIKESLKGTGPILITRILTSQVEVIKEIAQFNDKPITWDRYERTAIIGEIKDISDVPKVAILSGGTSDQPIVEEILFSLKYFGINAISYPDVGVAGIHRHQEVMDKLDQSIKVLIVVAGNEGALFSVISGQTKLPMIAVPTSIGYGFGGKGQTALQSALQSCSPGVVTVNIDNGFGAATFVKKLFDN